MQFYRTIRLDLSLSPISCAAVTAKTQLMRIRRDARRSGSGAVRSAHFLAWSARGEGAANLDRLRALRGRYEGRRCFVMGNGPSLLDCDLNLLAGEVTIVSNAHYLIWELLTYVPTFLTVEDRLVAEDRANELRSLAGLTTMFPFDLRHLLGSTTSERVYLNFARDYRGFPRFSYDLARRCYWGGTVSFLNLQLAAYLGCTTIILVGFDHSYVVPTDDIRDNVILSRAKDVNHVHPDYFGPGYRWHDPNVARMELAYHHARQALERVGVRVVNATAGGKLEVFEREPFESVISVSHSDG